MRIAASPLATEVFNEGETGASPKNTPRRAEATFIDSSVASILVGNPSDETATWKRKIHYPNEYVEAKMPRDKGGETRQSWLTSLVKWFTPW